MQNLNQERNNLKASNDIFMKNKVLLQRSKFKGKDCEDVATILNFLGKVIHANAERIKQLDEEIRNAPRPKAEEKTE